MRILLSGEGGQGIQTIAKILSDLAQQSGYEVVYMPHYGVEMRMGISLAYLQISQEKISYPKFDQAEIVAVLGKRDLAIPRSFIDKDTTVVNCLEIGHKLKENNLSAKTSNMVCLAIIIEELEKKYNFTFPEKIIRLAIQKYLGHKADLQANLFAFSLGRKIDSTDYSQPLAEVQPPIWDAIISEDEKKKHLCYPHLCKGCGWCLEQCPTQALAWSKEKVNFISRPLPEVDLTKCIACGLCQQVCPDCAIEVIKEK